MSKLIVLCAFLVAAAAEPKPGILFGYAGPYISPVSTVLSPASATITKQASSVVHPSPYFLSSPVAFPHFIKKRSATLPLEYIAPSSYISPYLAPISYSAPIVHSAPILPAAHLPYVATHLIKKRSAQFLPTTYLAPTTYAAGAPLLTTTYTAPLITSPVLHPTPLVSSPIAHLIKKRSAPVFAPVVNPIVSSYITPAAISHQSRIDLNSAPLISTFPSPIAISHVL